MQNTKTAWLITELSGEEASKKIDLSIDPFDSTKDFLKWQGSHEYFAFYSLRQKPSILSYFLGRKQTQRTTITAELHDMLHNQQLLFKAALSGHILVFASYSPLPQIKNFFERYGYIETGHQNLNEENKHPLFIDGWDTEQITQSLLQATKTNAHTLCCFAHDADPIYIISRTLD